MGLLSGALAVTRFNAAVPPDGPDFERARFFAIEPGSEVRERMGFVAFELDASYEVSKGRWAFRVRIDRVRPDATSVKERLKELIKAEMEATGQPFVGGKTRRKLRELAEAELAFGQAPRTKIVECVLDGPLLYVASTGKSVLGTVLTLLRQAGVEADFKAPWLDEAPQADESSDVVVPKEPGQSVLGCRFLKALLEEPEVMVEPEAGLVQLATREARVTLAGAVLTDLFRYLDEGAEILKAKIHLGKVPLTFDALSYRLSGVKLEPVQDEHWTIELDRRLEQVAALFATLDEKYRALAGRRDAAATPPPARSPSRGPKTPAASTLPG